MTGVVDTITAIVRNELDALRITELGVVKAVYPHSDASDDDNYGVDVALKASGLLLKRVPVATGHVGTVAIPNVDDQVLVAFAGGDVNAPIVVTRLYDDVDRPPTSTSDEIVSRLPLAAADDKTILTALRNHADRDPARELVIEMPPKITVRIVDGVVTATAGTTELRLDQTGSSGGTVTVTAGRTTITLDQDGDATLDSAGSITLKAARDLQLQAPGDITVDAGKDVTVRGTRATVNGSLQAELQGGAGATISGATVTVKGITSFTP